MSAFISCTTAPAPACTSARTALCDHNLWVNVDVPGLPMYFVPSSASVGIAHEPATRSIPTTPATPQLSVSTPRSPSSHPATSSASISSQPLARASASPRIPAAAATPAASSASTQGATSSTARAPFSVSVPASNPTAANAIASTLTNFSTPTLAATPTSAPAPFSIPARSAPASTSATAPDAEASTPAPTSRSASASVHTSTHASTSTTVPSAFFSNPPSVSTTATAPSPTFVPIPSAQPKEPRDEDRHSTAEVAGVQHTRKKRPLFADLRLRSSRAPEAQDAKKSGISHSGRRGVHIATAPSTATATVNPSAATPVAVGHADVGTHGDATQEPGTPVTPCTGDDGVSQDRTAATPRGRRLRMAVSGGLKSAGSAVKRVLLSPGRQGRGPQCDEPRKGNSGTGRDGSLPDPDDNPRKEGSVSSSRKKAIQEEEEEMASIAKAATATTMTAEEESQRVWVRSSRVDGEEVYEGGLLRRTSVDLGADSRPERWAKPVQHIPARRPDADEIIEFAVDAAEGGAGDAVVAHTVEAVGACVSDAALVNAKGAEEDGVERVFAVNSTVAGSAGPIGEDGGQGGMDAARRAEADDLVGTDRHAAADGSTVVAEQPSSARRENWVRRLRARVRGRRDAELRGERAPRKWPWVRRGAVQE